MTNVSEVYDLLSVAQGEVNYHEGHNASGWDNIQKYSEQVPSLKWSDGQAWCCTFVSWCAMKSDNAALFPCTASCAVAVEWFKHENRFSDYPAIGAQVFYGVHGDAHTGIVKDYDDTYIYTVEGNTNTNGSAEGDGVYLKARVRKDAYVYGYGYPKYKDGIHSADPKYAVAKPTAQPPVPPTPVPAKPTPVYAPFPGASFFRLGKKGDLVTAMGKRLVAEGYKGYKVGPGPEFSRADLKADAWYQRKLGYSGGAADGYPGPASWASLKVPKS